MRGMILSVALLSLTISVAAQEPDCTIYNTAWTAPLLPGNTFSDYQTSSRQTNPHSATYGM